MAAHPRPFGVGPYGYGPYSRWPSGANIYELGGATGIAFALQGVLVRVIVPEAITEIQFAAWAELAATWWVSDPCTAGDWVAGACSPGDWTPPPGCQPGDWQVMRP